MSEYQYYEFQAVDRPLDRTTQDALRSISSRARITANTEFRCAAAADQGLRTVGLHLVVGRDVDENVGVEEATWHSPLLDRT